MNIKTEDAIITIKQEPELKICKGTILLTDNVKCELQSETSSPSINETKCEIKSETSTNEKNQTPIYCHVCHEKFSNLDEIKVHYEQTHLNNKCNLCNIFLRSEKNFKIHNEKFHSVFVYKYDQNTSCPITTFKQCGDVEGIDDCEKSVEE